LYRYTLERLLSEAQSRAERAEGALKRERREHASRMCVAALAAAGLCTS
jgi:hypothetical protein